MKFPESRGGNDLDRMRVTCGRRLGHLRHLEAHGQGAAAEGTRRPPWPMDAGGDGRAGQRLESRTPDPLDTNRHRDRGGSEAAAMLTPPPSAPAGDKGSTTRLQFSNSPRAAEGGCDCTAFTLVVPSLHRFRRLFILSALTLRLWMKK